MEFSVVCVLVKPFCSSPRPIQYWYPLYLQIHDQLDQTGVIHLINELQLPADDQDKVGTPCLINNRSNIIIIRLHCTIYNYRMPNVYVTTPYILLLLIYKHLYTFQINLLDISTSFLWVYGSFVAYLHEFQLPQVISLQLPSSKI